ncbi:DUF7289 family protein [Halobaculum gomorrense]|uniref:DUF7305 domain-containing protein n=1 Tax=Halobaculum gomorrense TaxID=43928 RepID=A0A1M5S0X0_9EURY|nr:hypothetical protein [Halobaculum gomorrense]SHH32089.1 hypothetical protein SAMN05443636_2300 [Halobaculum gomorrense]
MASWGGDDRRAQGDVISVVLLLAITVAGASAVVALGGDAIGGIQESATMGAAEQSMTQFDSKASLVAHGESDAQRVRLSGSPTAVRSVRADRGWLNVTVRNVTDGSVERVLTNTTLGVVEYRDGDATIAYQGGGVWRSSEGGTTMVSPPEFHYQGTTLTLPLVTVAGDERLDGDVIVRQSGESTGVYPNASDDLRNPLQSGEVVVTVKSRYYEAWGRFFEQRTGGDVTIDHANGTATITLRTPPQVRPISSAVAATAAGDDLDMQGSGSFPAFTDSYNSSNGNYTETAASNGTVVTAGTVKLSGNSLVEGNVRAGGAVELSGTAELNGSAEWTTGFSASGGASYVSERQIDGVEAADPVDSFTRTRISELRSSNDNDDTSAISGDRLNDSGSTVTLSAGQYFLSGIDMNGETLVVDTADGLVEIAVEEDLSLDDASITVQGGGTVRFYVGDDISVASGSNVSVPGERSTGAWFYGTDDTGTVISGSQGDTTRFVGVLYAPSASNDVSVRHADVYGGLVAGEVDIETGGAVHYDQSLSTRTPLPADANVPRITYLHISVTEISVSED